VFEGGVLGFAKSRVDKLIYNSFARLPSNRSETLSADKIVFNWEIVNEHNIDETAARIKVDISVFVQ
jgi:hypothetical protein